MFGPLVRQLQGLWHHTAAAAVSQRCLRVAPTWLAGHLPALGHVLYVPMRPAGSADWEMPRGFLVEAMQLAPLLQVRWLVVASTITVEGPREWIECMDRHGSTCARLHLLPDTDYLAWDALLAGGEPMPAARLAHWPPGSRPAHAQLLRFYQRRLGGLDVLGAEAVRQVSPLSRHLAARIARAEAVPLQLATER